MNSGWTMMNLQDSIIPKGWHFIKNVEQYFQNPEGMTFLQTKKNVSAQKKIWDE